MQLKLKGDEIEDIRFQGEGCAISQAAASMLTELSKGNTVSFVKKLGRDDVLKLLGADPGPARMTCALLGLKVLKMAVYARLGEEMPREFEEE
jgi:nitrogen fixation NifU-like protein